MDDEAETGKEENEKERKKETGEATPKGTLPYARPHGLANTCAHYLGFPLSKSQRMSNWARRPLTEMQINYAALDAWCLKPLLDAVEKGWEDERKQGIINLPSIESFCQSSTRIR
jgi:hypothetical protein